MLDIRNHARDYLATHYAKTRKTDRQSTVGASDIGQCARKVVHQKIGTAPRVPITVNGFAYRGEQLEEHYLVPMVRDWAYAHDAMLLYAGKAQKRYVYGPLSCTPDGVVGSAPYDMLEPYGVVTIEGDCFAVEFKSFDPRLGEDSLPKPAHKLQVNTQLGILRRVSEFRPTYGLLIYCNASDPADIRPFAIEYDDQLFEGSVGRAKAIMDATSIRSWQLIRPEGKIDGGSECKLCEFDHSDTCGGYGFAVPDVEKPISDQARHQAQVLATRLLAIKETVSDLGDKKSILESHMKELMASVGTSCIRTEDFEVRWKKQAGSRRFSKDLALEKLRQFGWNGPDDDLYIEGDSTDRLTIKKV